MELTHLVVRDFAGIEAADLSFGPGLNVVVGDNEAGKSTLLAALRAAFFQKHRATGEAIKALAPYGRQARPQIDVRFRLGGADYALTKAFLQRAEARLEWAGGALSGDAVEEHLAGLLRFAHPGRGDSKLGEHQGAFGLLWVEQGRAPEGLDLGVGRHAVTASLEGEIGQILGGERGRQLLAAAKALQDRFFTDTLRHKITSPLKLAEDGLAALEAELVARQVARRDYEGRLERLADRRMRLSSYESENARGAAEAALAKAREAAAKLDSVRHELSAAERGLAHAQGAWERATERLETRRKLIEDETEARKQSGMAAVAFAELGERAGRLATERDATEAAFQACRQAADAAEVAAAAQEKADERARLETECARAAEALTLAQGIDARLRALDEGGAPIAITRAQLDALETAARARLEAEIRLSAAAPVLIFAPEGERSVRGGSGQAIAAGAEIRVSQAQDFILEGFGTLSVRPGGSAADLSAAARDAAEQEARLLAACGAAALDEARRRFTAAQEKDRERTGLTAELRRAAPQGLPALAGSVEDLAARIAALAPGDARLPEDRDALRSRRHALREEFKRTEAARDAARADLQAFEKELIRAETQARHLAGLAASRASELESAAGERSEAALQADVAAADVERRGCQTVLAVRRRELEIADPEGARLELSRAGEALERLDRTLSELMRETSTLEGELRMQGAVSLGEEIERLGGEIETGRERVRRLSLEADAARLLHSALLAAQREARDHWLSPIKESVGPYLRLIQPGTDIELDDSTLEIRGLQRSGREEEFRRLSRGAREQIAVLTRLALAEVLKRGGHPATVILDDALVNTDEKRLARMHLVLRKAAESLQIIILTCRERDFRDLGAPIVRL